LSQHPPNGSIQVTPPRALAVAALFGGLAGWLFVITVNALDLVPPTVPWTAPIGLILIAALVGLLGYTTRQRLQVRHERVEPQRAVAFLVLGKASALAGALVAGGYLGFAVNFLTRLDAVGPRDRVVRSAVAILAGIALCGAGLLLERACKVPGADDEDDSLSPDTRG
jgi:ABC-type Fe3+-siderophore transport system permease subunit